MKITNDNLNKVYTILVKYGGALEKYRNEFIYEQTRDTLISSKEYRFVGIFGFGGKYRLATNSVTMYKEDVTEDLQQKLDILNKKLANI